MCKTLNFPPIDIYVTIYIYMAAVVRITGATCYSI